MPQEKPNPLVPGTLDMLILRTLALEPLHGYGIGVRLSQISNGVFQVNAGSLFPAFRRLERDGLIKGEWRATENNRRAKYYALTARAKHDAEVSNTGLAIADDSHRAGSWTRRWGSCDALSNAAWRPDCARCSRARGVDGTGRGAPAGFWKRPWMRRSPPG